VTLKSIVKPETIIMLSKMMPAREKTMGRTVEIMPGMVLRLEFNFELTELLT